MTLKQTLINAARKHAEAEIDLHIKAEQSKGKYL